MIAPAAFAAMAALALPVSGSPVGVTCRAMPAPLEGYAYPWDARVELDMWTCRLTRDVIRHRLPTPAKVTYGLRVLLHEAWHVRQYNTGLGFDGVNFDEHEAECSTLTTVGPALQMLHYGNQLAGRSLRMIRRDIANEPAPYGGACP